MSDSLREQMLKAGFKESAADKKKHRPAKPKKKSSGTSKTTNRKNNNSSGPSSLERANIAEREAIAERKRIKAEIKRIIETAQVEYLTAPSKQAAQSKPTSDDKATVGTGVIVDTNNSAPPGALSDTEQAPTPPATTETKTVSDQQDVQKPTAPEISEDRIAHSYIIGKRIKQLFVSEELREKLVEGSLVITRLNGSTYLIPAKVGEQVRALNPDWVVITPNDGSGSEADDEYADYQVPDDLTW